MNRRSLDDKPLSIQPVRKINSLEIDDEIPGLLNRSVEIREDGRIHVTVIGSDLKEYSLILTGKGLIEIIKARTLREKPAEIQLNTNVDLVQCGDNDLVHDLRAPKTLSSEDILDIIRKGR